MQSRRLFSYPTGIRVVGVFLKEEAFPRSWAGFAHGHPEAEDRINRRPETDLNILFDIFQDGIRASPIEKDRFNAASGEKRLNARVPVPKKSF